MYKFPWDRFPKDCHGKNCPHFYAWDLNVDDITCTCDLLNVQCDVYDEDFCYLLCPLDSDQKHCDGRLEDDDD